MAENWHAEHSNKKEKFSRLIFFATMIIGIGCPLPCKQTTYSVKITTTHGNAWFAPGEISETIFWFILIFKGYMSN